MSTPLVLSQLHMFKGRVRAAARADKVFIRITRRYSPAGHGLDRGGRKSSSLRSEVQ